MQAALYRASNDTYWLVAPFKLRDPGASIVADGVEEIDGVSYSRLHLTFAGDVGQSPGDQFWLYTNPETGMLDRWAFFLEGFEGEPTVAQASEWLWQDWKEFDQVRIAMSRVLTRSPQFPQFTSGRIDFPVLTFLDEVDEAVFTDPATPLP